MEKVLDAVVAQLDIIKDLPYDEGGFLDEIDLPDNVWWGDPKILPSENYPFIYVEPVDDEKLSETTQSITRRLTIRVAVVTDPREYFDESEVSETSGSREMVRTISAIQRWFERKTIRNVNALSEDVVALEVGSTRYATQLRGSLYSSSAEVILVVDKKYGTLS